MGHVIVVINQRAVMKSNQKNDLEPPQAPSMRESFFDDDDDSLAPQPAKLIMIAIDCCNDEDYRTLYSYSVLSFCW